MLTFQSNKDGNHCISWSLLWSEWLVWTHANLGWVIFTLWIFLFTVILER